MKVLILLFMFVIFTLPVKSVCMLNEPCAVPDKSSNIEGDVFIDSNKEQQKKINFMPKFDISNQNTPSINQEYRPQQYPFQQIPAPKDCVFGLCLP